MPKPADPRQIVEGLVCGHYDTLLARSKEGCRSAANTITIIHTHHLLLLRMANLKECSICMFTN